MKKVKPKAPPVKRIQRMERITRKYIRAHPEEVFVFGDNADRSGFGGQAMEMRDEPNSVGVIVKRYPNRTEQAYFTGHAKDLYHLMNTLTHVALANAHGKTIVIPAAGLGTERAALKAKAPRLFKILNHFLKALEESESILK